MSRKRETSEKHARSCGPPLNEKSVSLTECIFRPLYHGVVAVGKPFGGVRPRRVYDVLGRLAFAAPQFRWHRNRWGHELELSPYYHIDRNILIFGTYDEALHLALERLVEPGDVCFDVGANLGEMTLHMAKLTGPTGAVHAFEPAPPALARLTKHIERNNLQAIVRAHAIALSDQTGTAEIAFADASQDNQGLGSIVDRGGKPGSMKATVETMTLDDFAARHDIRRLDLMKVDIQGAEPRLLEGGRRVLTELSPDVLMEISPEDLACAGKTSADLCRLIESYGYQMFHLTKSGGVGARIVASEVREDFSATNVYCTKKQLG